LLRQAVKVFAGLHPFNLDAIAAVADESYDVHVAMRELIAEYIHRHEELPPTLKAYNIRILNPHFRPPEKGSGQAKAANVLEDLVLMTLLMSLIERFHYLPTRGSQRRHCACSIVSLAATRAGLHRGDERSIKKIWDRYAPSVLPGSMAQAILLEKSVSYRVKLLAENK